MTRGYHAQAGMIQLTGARTGRAAGEPRASGDDPDGKRYTVNVPT